MSAVVELDPELAWKAIEGYSNELAPEQRALAALYRNTPCPGCGGACATEQGGARHAFGGGSLVPRSLLRCGTCRLLFDPHSGVVLERGHVRR